ncbi:hypothetical protein KDAU_54520 [Dictyobacter aurantiacus]|uniref:Uncharacterized protein n=1 Tax=Dictyobacter aurantiacus TaxID=1936993 RepID=A0A401ZMP1_9CHLR|nr:hypothetical protein KDAU_54520 [Dictyobacter aurantiacus]
MAQSKRAHAIVQQRPGPVKQFSREIEQEAIWYTLLIPLQNRTCEDLLIQPVAWRSGNRRG